MIIYHHAEKSVPTVYISKSYPTPVNMRPWLRVFLTLVTMKYIPNSHCCVGDWNDGLKIRERIRKQNSGVLSILSTLARYHPFPCVVRALDQNFTESQLEANSFCDFSSSFDQDFHPMHDTKSKPYKVQLHADWESKELRVALLRVTGLQRVGAQHIWPGPSPVDWGAWTERKFVTTGVVTKRARLVAPFAAILFRR